MARTLDQLGAVARSEGNVERAKACLAESLALSKQRDDKFSLAECLEGLGALAASEHEFKRAAQFLGAAETLRERIEAPLSRVGRSRLTRWLSMLHAGLDEECLAAEWSAGKAMAPEDVIITM